MTQASVGTENRLRFGGQYGYIKDASDRLGVRARSYRPSVGRWISTDPLGFGAGDYNLYRYVKNNPVGSLDASGLSPSNCCKCGPEIGYLLPGTLNMALAYLKTLGKYDRIMACTSLVGFPRAMWSWDIYPLHDKNYESQIGVFHRGCATAGCEKTVMVGGQCHKSRDVNYLLYGYLMKLCYRITRPGSSAQEPFSQENMISMIEMWKKYIRRDPKGAERAVAWGVAGYNHTKYPTADPTLIKCKPCGQRYNGTDMNPRFNTPETVDLYM